MRDEAPAAAELAAVCGYLPLALRIAAANLTLYPDGSIARYVSRLRADKLGGLEVAGDEKSSVRAAFDLSYRALAEPVRQMFARLSAVPGPSFSVDVAAALTETTPARARRLLAELAASHLLLRVESDRYAFHDLLRAYAAEHAAAGDGTPERLYDWYLHGVDVAASRLYAQMLRLPVAAASAAVAPTLPVLSDQTAALAWLESERPNLVAAVCHAADHGPYASAARLADALRGYFSLGMHAVDWLACASAGLIAARRAGDRLGEGAAQLSLGDANMRHGQYDMSVDHYTQAHRLHTASGWVLGAGAALGNLGTTLVRGGQLEKAAEVITEMLSIARAADWIEGQAAALGNLGCILADLGRMDEARVRNEEALDLHRRTGAQRGEAMDLSNLADVYHVRGDHDRAVELHTEALALHREIGSGGAANTLASLAVVYNDTGRHAKALDLAMAAVTLARDLKDSRYATQALVALGATYGDLGRTVESGEYYREALGLARSEEIRDAEVRALIGLAHVESQAGTLETAIAHAAEAADLAVALGFGLREGEALTALATVHLAAGHSVEAIRHGQRALAIHRRCGYRIYEARTLAVLRNARMEAHRPAAPANGGAG